MPKLLSITQRLIKRPFRTRGSILIMVVAVLVLLALMGTAYISIARIDRLSSIPLNDPTVADVIDQLIPSIETMAETTIKGDVLLNAAGGGYRPGLPVGTTDYEATDYASPNLGSVGAFTLVHPNDGFMSSRLPTREPRTNLTRTDTWAWLSLSRPLNQPDPSITPPPVPLPAPILFESPYDIGVTGAKAIPLASRTGILAPYPQYTQDFDPTGPLAAQLPFEFVPTTLTVTYPNGYSDASLAGRTRVFPALALYHPGPSPFYITNPPASGNPGDVVKFLAADADGDGIADSGLWRVTTVGDITYYAACRIIDNNSAINVNTAWSRDLVFGGANQHTNWVFPESVGLLELLGSAPELNAVNIYRCNDPSGAPAPQPVDDPVTVPPPNPNPQNRNDCTFITNYDALYHMLARRMDNPGYRQQGSPLTPYQAFTTDTNLDLYYRGGSMMNPASVLPTGTLDLKLFQATGGTATTNGTDSVYSSAVNETAPSPQTSVDARFRFLPPTASDPLAPAADVNSHYWFEQTYDSDTAPRNAYLGSAAQFPTRSFLTTNNAVSILISGHTSGQGNVPDDAMLPYGSRGRWHPVMQYSVHDIVEYYDSTIIGPAKTRLYMAIAGNTNLTPTAANIPGTWVMLNSRGAWAAGAAPVYNQGDVVKLNFTPAAPPAGPGVLPDWRVFVNLVPNNNTNPSVAGAAGWYPLPGYTAPPKVSLNTAPFEELYRGFWNTMVDVGDSTPFDTLLNNAAVAVPGEFDNSTFPRTYHNPYIGMQFYSEYPPPPLNPQDPNPVPFEAKGQFNRGDSGPFPPNNEARMFRTPLRQPPFVTGQPFTQATRRMTPSAVMKIRAALAAVNAEDMRDADNDVTARKISVQMQEGGVPYNCDVVVYGTEAQPYITEVYANTDVTSRSLAAGVAGTGMNANGYVAIELFNPYPFDIPLRNWRLVALNRLPIDPGMAAGTGMPATADMILNSDQVIADFSLPPFDEILVPAQGYLLLENYVDANPPDPYGQQLVQYTGANPNLVTPANYRPGGTGLPPAGPIPGSLPGNSPSTVANPRTVPPAPRLNVAYMPLVTARAAGPQMTAPQPNQPPVAAAQPNTVFNQEVVFMRPRRFSGDYTGALPAAEARRIGYTNDDSGVNPQYYIRDFVPVDSYDFTGLVLPLPNYWRPLLPPGGANSAPPGGAAWHYARASNCDPAVPGGVLKNWHFVYPGRYDAMNTLFPPPAGNNTMPNDPAPNPPGMIRARLQGTQEATWNPSAGNPEMEGWDPQGLSGITGAQAVAPIPPLTTPVATFGVTYGLGIPSTNADVRASYPVTFPIQLAFNNFVTPDADLLTAGQQPGSCIGLNGFPPTAPGAPVQFPYGGFSRNGEVLYVPFIGAYRVTINDPNYPTQLTDDYIVELNSVTMDAAMAEDTYTADDPTYIQPQPPAPPPLNVGAPINTGAYTETIEQIGRFIPPNRFSSTVAPIYQSLLYSYEWAGDILDHFTAIQNSNDDFLPNVDPARYPAAAPPRAIANSKNANENTDNDWVSGTQGLINVNTADWKVLSMLPLCVTAAGTVDVPNTETLARAIVYYRDIDDGTGGAGQLHPHGPFKNLFELNQVVNPPSANGFQNMMGDLNLANADPTETQGDFTRGGVVAPAVTDGVRFDFEERELNLIRLSNLLTTRSDVFTCYVLIQGFKNVGTDHPQLVGERRSAFIVDRSTLSSTNSTPKVTKVPSR